MTSRGSTQLRKPTWPRLERSRPDDRVSAGQGAAHGTVEGQPGMIDTPEFMRGIHAVGGFNPAPALEPQLGGYYWVTPIAKTWSQERVESKLRGYNNFGLQHLTIHEAMPGHYVQLEYANDVQPKSRRLLRNVFGNGPYIEGWAVYAQQLMTDQGYLNNDPGMRLTWYKQLLRVLANTI